MPLSHSEENDFFQTLIYESIKRIHLEITGNMIFTIKTPHPTLISSLISPMILSLDLCMNLLMEDLHTEIHITRDRGVLILLWVISCIQTKWCQGEIKSELETKT